MRCLYLQNFAPFGFSPHIFEQKSSRNTKFCNHNPFHSKYIETILSHFPTIILLCFEFLDAFIKNTWVFYFLCLITKNVDNFVVVKRGYDHISTYFTDLSSSSFTTYWNIHIFLQNHPTRLHSTY